MSLEAFNAIAQNIRQQFPGMSEVFVLQKTTEIYLAWIKVAAKRTPTNATKWAEIERLRQEMDLAKKEAEQKLKPKRKGLFGGGK